MKIVHFRDFQILLVLMIMSIITNNINSHYFEVTLYIHKL